MADVGSAATMCEAFQATAARYPQQVAVRTPGGGGDIDLGGVRPPGP
jgi:hypothetical protein